jgi:hypothetical protein
MPLFSRAALIVVLLSLLYCMAYVFLVPADTIGGDFQVFYHTSQEILSGRGADIYQRSMQQMRDGFSTPATNPFPYPPYALPFIAPLALAGFTTSFLLWSLIGLACLCHALRLPQSQHHYAALAVRPWFYRLLPLWVAGSGLCFNALIVGQTDAFMAALLLAGLVLRKDRPVAAGLCFALLTLKPQLGLLIPFLLLLEKNHRCFLSASAGFLVLAALSLIWPGPAVWPEFIAHSRAFTQLLTNPDIAYPISRSMISFFQSYRLAGLETQQAGVAHTLTILLLIPVWACSIRRYRSEGLTLCLTLITTLLLSPYALTYNLLSLLLVAFLLLSHANGQNCLRHAAMAGGIVFLPFITLAANQAGYGMTPWLLVLLMAYLIRQRNLLFTAA